LNERTRRFEAVALPHLNAAYNLARWLLRDDRAAEDVVQEAYLRGFRFFDSFRGGDARPWLLGIVRNRCYSWLEERGHQGETVEFDEERDSLVDSPAGGGLGDPETLLLRKLDQERIDRAIDSLPPAFREVIVLRELEAMSYEEISVVAGVPAGTVMSRLARARALLRQLLRQDEEKEGPHGSK
jgi:RNA polymerase sigma-70 factor (ECF subfamily)